MCLNSDRKRWTYVLCSRLLCQESKGKGFLKISNLCKIYVRSDTIQRIRMCHETNPINWTKHATILGPQISPLMLLNNTKKNYSKAFESLNV